MKPFFSNLLALLCVLIGLVESVGAANTWSLKTASGDFWEEAVFDVGWNSSQSLKGHWDEMPFECLTASDVGYGPNVYTYVRQNPWTYYDPLGLERYKGSDADEEDWGKLTDKAQKSLKNYKGKGGASEMLEKAGFATDGSKPLSISQRKATLESGREVEYVLYQQGSKSFFTRDVWGAAKGGGVVQGVAVQGWDNVDEFNYDLNMDDFWRGKGGEAFQRGISVAAGLSGGHWKTNS